MYGGTFNKYTKTISTSLNKCVRNIFFSNTSLVYSNTSDSYKYLNLLKFEEIYIIKLCEFIWASINGKRIILQDFLDEYRRPQVHNTRNNHDLLVPEIRLCEHQSFFLHNAIKHWNRLDDDIKAITDFNVFRKKLRTKITGSVETELRLTSNV